MESELIILTLQHSSMVSLFLDVFGILDDEFVLLYLELVSFFSEVQCFLLGIAKSSLAVVEVSSHGSDNLSFLGGVLNSELESVVVRDQLANLLLVALLDLGKNFFMLNLEAFIL